MAYVSLRVTDAEKEMMVGYAKFCNTNISEVLKEAFFEKLEDEYDLKLLEAYDAAEPHETYTMDEVGKMIGVL
jgi:hypothetical protein